MGALFSKPERPKPVAPPPEEEEEDPRLRRAQQIGRASLINTTSRGVLSPPSLGRRQLTAG